METVRNKEKERSEATYNYDEAVELTGHGYYNYLLLITCSVISNACALDMFGYATVVAASSCDLNLSFTQIGILASAPFAGVLFAFPWGYYSDTRGRKRALIISTSVGFVFAVISAFSSHWLFMLITKIIGCSFSTASFYLTMALLGECTGNKHRSQYLFIMNSFNLASELFAFALAWMVLPLNFKVPLPLLHTTFRPWRLFTIVIALPLGIGAGLMLSLYESPKYLADKGQIENALEVMRSIYERNGGKRENYPVKYITPVNDETSLENHSFWQKLKKQTLPIFQPPLLWRTIQLFFLTALCCATNNTFIMWYPTMVNYFFKSFNTQDSSDLTFCERMFGNTNTTSDGGSLQCNDEISTNTLYAGMLYGLFFLIVSLAVVKVASRPRMLLLAVLLVSGCSGLLVNVKNAAANVIFFTLLQATSLGIGCISSYFIHFYPTSQRGQVTSLGMLAARLCALISVNLVGPFITRHCEMTFFVSASFVFVGVLVAFFLPADRNTKITNDPS